jgi:hypothetical protein
MGSELTPEITHSSGRNKPENSFQQLEEKSMTTDYIPRLNFGAPLEPANTVLHGAGQDPEGFDEYCSVVGPTQQPVLYMTYVAVAYDKQAVLNWHQRIKQHEEELKSRGLLLQVGVNMTGGNDTGEGRDALIASGECDENLIAFCDALQDLNLPALVRIGYEFEGHWNGYQPDTYRAAYIRITEMLRKRDIVAPTVWCSGGNSEVNMSLDDRMAYYPGDEWVDWWGIDTFDAHEMLHPRTTAFYKMAAQHQKPVLIGESTPRYVGVLDGQASWNQWFVPYFEMICQQPVIKAMCYINWDWVYWSNKIGFEWHDWGDGRLQQNEVVSALYRQTMASPLFQHAPQRP